MKIILLKDVKNVGKKDEVKEVSDGYARNFLIKNKMAVAYTKGSVKVLDHQLEEKKLHEEDLKKQAEKIAEELKTTPVEFMLNTGKDGQAFGSVSSKQIAEALNKKGIIVDKRKIHMDIPVSSIGTTRVKVDLYKGQVIGEIVVQVRPKG